VSEHNYGSNYANVSWLEQAIKYCVYWFCQFLMYILKSPAMLKFWVELDILQMFVKLNDYFSICME